jgi:glycosyltransferase involved in cell wall biosynthesis/SAM-dependent methyltransferase
MSLKLTEKIFKRDEALTKREVVIAAESRKVQELEKVLLKTKVAYEQTKSELKKVLSSKIWRITNRLYLYKKKSEKPLESKDSEQTIYSIKIEYPLNQELYSCHQSSGVFNPDWYLDNNPDLKSAGIDPWDHFFTHGIWENRAPNPEFKPLAYLIENPDVAASTMGAVEHFMTFGWKEGRDIKEQTLRLDSEALLNKHREQLVNLDKKKKTVLLVTHDISRTGAPILVLNLAGKLRKDYTVITLALSEGSGGILSEEYMNASDLFIASSLNNLEDLKEEECQEFFSRFIKSIKRIHHIDCAIVNTIESTPILKPLWKANIPASHLIHEFSSYTRPETMFPESSFYSVKQIYSSKLLLEDALTKYPDLGYKMPVVLPQGRCIPPIKQGSNDGTSEERQRIDSVLRPPGSQENLFVVIGLGSIHFRKGVDLFIQCAQRVMKTRGQVPIRFVWFGHGYDVKDDNRYSSYLHEQIWRSGVNQMCVITHETDQLDHVYKSADLLFLSSRLDPLPLVSHDMMAQGKPVICFERATGLAEFLVESPEAASCVIDYMDVEAAASRILDLVNDSSEYKKVGNLLKSIVDDKFNLDNYVKEITDQCEELFSINKIISEFLCAGASINKCPVCNSLGGILKYRWDRFLIVTCQKCDSDYIYPQPSQEELKQAYDNPSYFGGGEFRGGYTDYDEQTNLVMPVFSEILNNLEQNLKGRRLLDIGCAYGMHLEVAADRGWEVTGIEISDHARAEAQRRLQGRFKIYQGVSDIPSQPFDVVMFMDVVEHYGNPREVFHDLFSKKLIGPETRIVITTPNARSSTSLASGVHWQYYHPPFHLTYFSVKSLYTMLKELGFADVSVVGIHPPCNQDILGAITSSEGLLAIAHGKNEIII